ncbi:DUF2815 family protein [Paenibacillus senegalensis]|uniref:DUF2815 family protein n=1 Tax=Paenibacillus senegalensis TaxID=1465766 RepID=UPI0002896CC7|nr:DUF2815 family protein [Paenibacillus senegalensis]
METKVITGKCRLSYAHVFAPNKDGKYSVSVLIPKSDKKTVKKIKDAIEAAKELGKSKWGGKVPKNLKLPLRDGDVDREDDEAYEGHYFVNANSNTKPGIIDLDKIEITDSTEVYSGSYARLSLNFYPYDRDGSKGIACGLNNIQKVADGDPLGGRARAEDDFDDEYDDEEEDF